MMPAIRGENWKRNLSLKDIGTSPWTSTMRSVKSITVLLRNSSKGISTCYVIRVKVGAFFKNIMIFQESIQCDKSFARIQKNAERVGTLSPSL